MTAPMSPERPADPSFWFAAPAADWTAALPLGNGRIGAMVFGEPRRERILLNETGIWAGGPPPAEPRDGPAVIAEIRRRLFAGDASGAEALCAAELLDPDPDEGARSYQPAGYLRLDHELPGGVGHYRRELDLEQGVAVTRLSAGGVRLRREAFVSAPDQVLVVTVGAEADERVSLRAGLARDSWAEIAMDRAGRVWLEGWAAADDGSHPGTRFTVALAVRSSDGDVARAGEWIAVRGASRVTLVLAVASDYHAADPEQPRTDDRAARCREQLSAALARSDDELRARHVADHRRLYARSRLAFAPAPVDPPPLDERVRSAAAGNRDPALLDLYLAYCRYLVIAASRAGGLPMHLQGIWNPMHAAPWRSDWHLNINLQEAYWFVEQAGLAECHEPLLGFLEDLRPRGERMARDVLGVSDGFAAAHRTDGTRFTVPTQRPMWGMNVAAGAWCAQHLMEHFRFTQDTVFLRERALPILASVARFWCGWLVPEPGTGRLVSGPSTSPENRYALADGTSACLVMGSTHDQEIAWSSLRDYLEACSTLGIENGDTAAAREVLGRLALPAIAPDGRLQEWPEPYAEVEPGHRHLSHLWGMMPGDRINLRATPELARAVAASLDHRLAQDYDAQGWSLGWAACLLARLGQGDRALRLIETEYFRRARPNLFVDAHGHTQVGDMMGVPRAVIELLVQSHAGEIELLPALPESWAQGTVHGLRARGGFELDLTWSGGRLQTLELAGERGGSARLRYGEWTETVTLEAGERRRLAFPAVR